MENIENKINFIFPYRLLFFVFSIVVLNISFAESAFIPQRYSSKIKDNINEIKISFFESKNQVEDILINRVTDYCDPGAGVNFDKIRLSVGIANRPTSRVFIPQELDPESFKFNMSLGQAGVSTGDHEYPLTLRLSEKYRISYFPSYPDSFTFSFTVDRPQPLIIGDNLNFLTSVDILPLRQNVSLYSDDTNAPPILSTSGALQFPARYLAGFCSLVEQHKVLLQPFSPAELLHFAVQGSPMDLNSYSTGRLEQGCDNDFTSCEVDAVFRRNDHFDNVETDTDYLYELIITRDSDIAFESRIAILRARPHNPEDWIPLSTAEHDYQSSAEGSADILNTRTPDPETPTTDYMMTLSGSGSGLDSDFGSGSGLDSDFGSDSDLDSDFGSGLDSGSGLDFGSGSGGYNALLPTDIIVRKVRALKNGNNDVAIITLSFPPRINHTDFVVRISKERQDGGCIPEFTATESYDSPATTKSSESPITTVSSASPLNTESSESPITTKSSASPLTTKSSASPLTTKSSASPLTTESYDLSVTTGAEKILFETTTDGSRGLSLDFLATIAALTVNYLMK